MDNGNTVDMEIFITTSKIKRTRLKDLPFRANLYHGITGGWELWQQNVNPYPEKCIGDQYSIDGDWLVIDVDGHVICDNRERR